jgi:competence protein J (ComJ)
MTPISFPLEVSYSQIVVFDSSLEKPFNDWTDEHVQQGFAWRPGSVSFGALEGDGSYAIELVTEVAEVLPQAERVIQVPFEVSPGGSIEIASIPDSRLVSIPPGVYQLRFECCPELRVRLVIIKSQNPSFEIVRADAELSRTKDLVLTAWPA